MAARAAGAEAGAFLEPPRALPWPSPSSERSQDHDIPAAYPLAREAAPGFTLEAWTRHARRVAARSAPARLGWSGILVARVPGHAVLPGLLLYRIEPDLRHERILVADPVIAIDLLDPRPILDALIAALDGIAAGIGCPVVRSVVQAGRGEMTRRLIDAGYAVEGALFTKSLGGAPPASPFPVIPAPR